MASVLQVCVVFVCALLCSSFITVSASYSDVCILGGGASGAASAVFLKQLGYSVRVIEKNSTLGGHCNTVHYEQDGQPSYIDIGVQAYLNTSFCNANGFGSWTFNSVDFVEQFVPAIFPLGGTGDSSPASFFADFKTGQLLNSTATNATEFLIAIETLAAFVANYPWLNTGDRPDPIPAELLVPFKQFVEELHLQPLILTIFNPFLFGGGSPPLEELSTLTALHYLSSCSISLMLGSAGAGFIIPGGCQVLYDGIAAYLGADSLTLTATITDVDRYGRHPTVEGYTTDSAGARHSFSYSCGKLIVSFPPLLSNLLPWFDLSIEEIVLFSQLVAQGYLALATTFTEGPLTAGQSFSINNVDPTRPQSFNLPQMPNLSIFSRGLPVGPAAAWVNAQSSLIPASVLLSIAETQFQGVPSALLSNVSIFAWSLHQYGAHWNNWAQALSPSPDTAIRKLQGAQNTYWVGAALTLEGSNVVWNHAYNLIHENFPRK